MEESTIKELEKDFGTERLEQILSAKNEKTCLSFYQIDGKRYLTDLGVEFEETPFENVFLTKNFVRNADYDLGIYTYQALGSVAICDAVESGDKLLDCCSAPGGKSIRLSHKFNTVRSWDIHEHRVNLIDEYAERMKRTNIITEQRDAKVFDKQFESSFSAVLCDVPCSGMGVVNDNPDIKLNREETNIKQLNTEQLAILKTASKYVEIGGYLYYSTCSIFNSENIDIIKTFLSKNDDYEICKLDSKLPHEDIMGTNLFLPDISGGLGFYIAKLKRVK